MRPCAFSTGNRCPTAATRGALQRPAQRDAASRRRRRRATSSTPCGATAMRRCSRLRERFDGVRLDALRVTHAGIRRRRARA